MLPPHRTTASIWRLFGCRLIPVISLMLFHQSLGFDTFSYRRRSEKHRRAVKPILEVVSFLVAVLAQADKTPEAVSDPGPVVPVA